MIVESRAKREGKGEKSEECSGAIYHARLNIEHGYLVEYISEINPGLDDHEIVKLATKKSAILITEDSDFGGLFNF